MDTRRGFVGKVLGVLAGIVGASHHLACQGSGAGTSGKDELPDWKFVPVMGENATVEIDVYTGSQRVRGSMIYSRAPRTEAERQLMRQQIPMAPPGYFAGRSDLVIEGGTIRWDLHFTQQYQTIYWEPNPGTTITPIGA